MCKAAGGVDLGRRFVLGLDGVERAGPETGVLAEAAWEGRCVGEGEKDEGWTLKVVVFVCQVTVERDEAVPGWKRAKLCVPTGSTAEVPLGVSVAQWVSAFGC